MDLILIRGLPGSGKSTLAKKFIGYYHLEADQYFMHKGEYGFNPRKIKDAHQWCQQATRTFLEAGGNVVVSNTFTQKWELEPYLELATEFNIIPTILEVKGNFQNIHGVPDEIIEKMKSRWESLD